MIPEQAGITTRRAAARARRFAHTVWPGIQPPAVDHIERNEAFGRDRRLALLHVPKSAGNSIAVALSEALRDRSWSPYWLDPTLFGSMRSEPIPPNVRGSVIREPLALRSYEVVSGHISLPALLSGFDRADVVLLVREPRSRVLSLYEYWRALSPEQQSPENTWPVVGRAAHLDFGEWLSDAVSAYQTDNVTIRMLLGSHQAIPDDDFIAAEDLPLLTKLAIREARSIGWTDIVERGHAMWHGLSQRIGAELTPANENVTGRSDGLATDARVLFDPSTVELLDARVAGDAAVWASVAVQRSVRKPALEADKAWMRRLGQTTLTPPT